MLVMLALVDALSCNELARDQIVCCLWVAVTPK